MVCSHNSSQALGMLGLFPPSPRPEGVEGVMGPIRPATPAPLHSFGPWTDPTPLIWPTSGPTELDQFDTPELEYHNLALSVKFTLRNAPR